MCSKWVPRAVTFKLESDEELMMTKIFKVVLDVSKAGRRRYCVIISTYVYMDMNICRR